jgi:arabinose-5-phosphate isomerase
MGAALDSIDAKIDALAALRDTIEGDALINAIQAVLHCDGKVVLSGIGKSGYIARKIAATFQSTGQQAVFLHPAEASHGDMGIIDPYRDMVLMISNSGATQELYPLMAYAEKNAISVILITSRPESELAVKADIVLATPRLAEGCPLGVAPMSSAVAQLAIGDALAAELMIARGFKRCNFAELHHGGYLGASIR